jgi:hypothetical protein
MQMMDQLRKKLGHTNKCYFPDGNLLWEPDYMGSLREDEPYKIKRPFEEIWLEVFFPKGSLDAEGRALEGHCIYGLLCLTHDADATVGVIYPFTYEARPDAGEHPQMVIPRLGILFNETADGLGWKC